MNDKITAESFLKQEGINPDQAGMYFTSTKKTHEQAMSSQAVPVASLMESYHQQAVRQMLEEAGDELPSELNMALEYNKARNSPYALGDIQDVIIWMKRLVLPILSKLRKDLKSRATLKYVPFQSFLPPPLNLKTGRFWNENEITKAKEEFEAQFFKVIGGLQQEIAQLKKSCEKKDDEMEKAKDWLDAMATASVLKEADLEGKIKSANDEVVDFAEWLRQYCYEPYQEGWSLDKGKTEIETSELLSKYRQHKQPKP